MKNNNGKTVLLVASGDSRLISNQQGWDTQNQMEKELQNVVSNLGYNLERAHPYKKDKGHGFISSQKEGLEIFSKIDIISTI